MTKKFKKYLVREGPHRLLGGEMLAFVFPNGYGASVIRHLYSYGGPEGKWEVGVVKDGALTYETPVTDDVIGHLEWAEVEGILAQVEALPNAEPKA